MTKIRWGKCTLVFIVPFLHSRRKLIELHQKTFHQDNNNKDVSNLLAVEFLDCESLRRKRRRSRGTQLSSHFHVDTICGVDMQAEKETAMDYYGCFENFPLIKLISVFRLKKTFD